MLPTSLDQIQYSLDHSVPASIQSEDILDVMLHDRAFTEKLSDTESHESYPIRAEMQGNEPYHITVFPTQLRQCTQAMHNALCNQDHTQFTHPVFANTEFYKNRGRPNLLVMVGESWVYGGKIRDMNIQAHDESISSFAHAVSRTVGACAADLLHADLYQYAYPGNNNYAMTQWLVENLPTLVNMPQYQQVFVLIQHTDQIREIGQPEGISALCGEHSVFTATVQRLITGENTWQNIDHWLRTYTAPITHTLNQLTELNHIKPVHVLQWSNFANVQHTHSTQFSVHPQSWTQFNAQLEGITIPDVQYSNAGLNTAVFTHSSIEQEQHRISIIEHIDEYWSELSPRVLSLHQHYPSRISHRLWAAQLTTAWRQAGLPSAPQKFWTQP